MKKTIRIFSVVIMVVIGGLLMIKVAKAVEAPSVSPTTTPSAGDISNQDIVFLPTISVEDLKVDKNSDGEVSGTFSMHNYSDVLIGDLGYKVSLIDAAPELKENTVVAESYQTYKTETFLSVATLSPEEKKTVSFKLQTPVVPKGQYRVRVRIQTSKNIGLGWDDINVSLGQDMGYIIVPIAWVAKADDLKTKSYALAGLNVDPLSDVTLGFGYTNSGTKAITVKPHIKIVEATKTDSIIFEQTGDTLPVVAPVKKITDGLLKIKAPEKPGSYTIYLDFVDPNGKIVSSVSEYRLVVKGESGKIINAWFKELTATKADIAFMVVGPADDYTGLDAVATVALTDNGNQIAEQTTETLKLNEETGKSVSAGFIFNISAEIKDPGLKVTLKDTKGNILDTYEYRVPASKITVAPNTAQPISTKSQKQNIGLLILGIIIAILGVTGAIWSLLRGHRRGKNNIATTVMMLMIVVGGGITIINLPIARAYIFETNTTPAAGAGNHYYMYTGNVLAYMNKPITIDQSVAVSKTVPINFTMEWAKCYNVTINGGYAIDYLKAGGKIVPTTSNWVPINDQLKLEAFGVSTEAHADRVGYYGYRVMTDKDNWTVVKVSTETEGTVDRSDSGTTFDYCGVECGNSGGGTFYIASTEYNGSFTVTESIKDTTFRLTGYRKDMAYGGVDWWFGIYGWLNFNNQPTTNVGLPSGTGPQTATATVTDLEEDPVSLIRWIIKSKPLTSTTANLLTSPSTAGHNYRESVGTYPNTLTPDVFGQYCVQAEAVSQYANKTVIGDPPTTSSAPAISWHLSNTSNATGVIVDDDVSITSGGLPDAGQNYSASLAGHMTVGVHTVYVYVADGSGYAGTYTVSSATPTIPGAITGNVGGPWSAKACAILRVTPPPPPPPPPAAIVTLFAAPNPVNSGSASTLTWTTTNATSCTASSPWLITGDKPTSNLVGETTGNLTSAKTYTLTCSNGEVDTVSSPVTVTVTPAVVSLTCSLASGQSTSVYTGSDVAFSAVGGSGNGYSLIFTDNEGGSPKVGNPLTAIFTKAGTKHVKVQDSNGNQSPNDCTPYVTVNNRQDPGDIREQ